MPKPTISALAEAAWYPEAQFTITDFSYQRFCSFLEIRSLIKYCYRPVKVSCDSGQLIGRIEAVEEPGSVALCLLRG